MQANEPTNEPIKPKNEPMSEPMNFAPADARTAKITIFASQNHAAYVKERAYGGGCGSIRLLK